MKVFGILLLLISGLLGCNKLYFQPDHYLHYPPESIAHLTPKLIQFKSGDGENLYGWHFINPINTKGLMIQFHGNSQNMSSHYLAVLWAFYYGYDIFTFDYRGYGKNYSNIDQIKANMDGLAALTAIKTDQYQKVVVWGQSLGGIIALAAISQSQLHINLVILESTFYSYHSHAQSILAQHWMTWLFQPLASLLVNDEYDTLGPVVNNNRPILVVHDENDTVVPFSEGMLLYEKINGHKEMWTDTTGQHIRYFDSNEHKIALIQYLEKI